tara:strand:+ start:1265 stop:1396 length:132 start_codon:yes stop_codon:yes gene_type:complete
MEIENDEVDINDLVNVPTKTLIGLVTEMCLEIERRYNEDTRIN